MADPNTDRNLLFGVLALQLDLIDARQFADACSGWSARREESLADLLIERGWIGPDDRAEVDRLLERKLRKHSGDVHASLAEAADDRARAALSDATDESIRDSLAELPHPAGHVLLSTIAYQPESRERYTLTRLHAQGGLGRVWLARDADLGRDVALKELRPERVGSPVVWSRFLEEAKITGQLEHPNIVPVHELVRPTDGHQPFYTMRFVKGRTLSEATRAYHARRAEGRAGPLESRELLHAFLGVCNAVGYAHARGVIHRDLKGQNVVLGDFGEVVVLDWGLAKLVDRPEDTLTPGVELERDEGRGETLAGQALGTPGYMAPEQAAGDWGRVDRRSDVYGLGAILYEILAGEPPFTGDDTAEVLRRVVQEPPAPPRSRNPEAPRALEAVCLKALSKRPEDRYDSAAALADEVKHFLADEPVAACPEPLPRRLGRWARRHRTLVGSAAALLIASVVGLTAGTILLSQANARTEAQRRLAQANYERAEASFRQARRAVDDYFTTISESRLLKVPGLQPLRKELLEQALKYYQDFIGQRNDDPAVKAELAGTYYRVGWITGIVGPKERTEEAYRRALALYDDLIGDRPAVERHRIDRAIVLNDLGNAIGAVGRFDEALRVHREALDARKALADAHPDEGRFHNELAKSHANVGGLLVEAGRPAEALAEYEAARALNERWYRTPAADLADFPSDLGRNFSTPEAIRLDLAIDVRWIGTLHYRQGRTAEAIRAYEQARDHFEAIAREHPDDIVSRSHLADVVSALGFTEGIAGRHDESLRSHRRALEIVERLASENPAVANFRGQLASAHRDVGRALRRMGRTAEARPHLDRAITLQEGLVRDEPDVAGYADALAYIYREAGWVERLEDDPAEALRRFRQARAIDEELAARSVGARYNLACDWAACIPLIGWGKAEADLSDAERAERERSGDEAMKALRSASEQGWVNADHMTRDEDLDGLRDRPDFRALLASLAGVEPPRAASR